VVTVLKNLQSNVIKEVEMLLQAMDVVLPVPLNLDGFVQILLLYAIQFVKMEFLHLQKFVMTI